MLSREMGLASRPSLRLFSAAKPAAVLNTSSRSSFVLTRRNRAGLPSITAAALPEAVSSGVDTAAAELILRSASHGFTSSADAHSMSTLFHSLNHAIGTSHALHSQASDGLVAFSDLASTVDHQSLAQEAWSQLAGGLPSDQLLVDHQHLTDAAAQSLKDFAGSTATMADSAIYTAALASSSVDSTLTNLLAWANERIAVVASIDPQSYISMGGSLNELVDGLKQSLGSETSTLAAGYTNALVLGVQQLVTALSLTGDGVGDGTTIGTMVAAQDALAEVMKKTSQESTFILQMSLAAIAVIVASVPRADYKAPAATSMAEGLKDEVPLRYSPDDLADYFSRRPVIVVQRNAVVAKHFCVFVGSLLLDSKTGVWEKNMASRAKWLREIAEELGPAYIKFVQAASTRVDMLPDEYLSEFAKLQDNVPTFSTMEARGVLEEGLGTSVDNVFEWISEEPLAAASLGQVYKGMLKPEHGGVEVAIKVQRPGVLESAALDIFVMRRACLLFSKLPGMSDQWACALDDWAYRFFQEMDYQLEAYNTMTFERHMADLKGVTVATVHPDLTSRKVIITDWIEAERLSDANPEDVKAMCSTLLNCYLIQLLETGLLHADPHPGNLMRTADGRIVILDFGLVTEVAEDQRIALVEFIAHLMLENWEAVTEDLAKLGFMPDGLPPGVGAAEVAPVMKSVMGQIVKGGGIRGGINIVGITAELEGVARNYKLCIPPYFALVLRAFAVIEGIALKADPEYAIVHQCLPYLSRRLLTDNNPRMRAALKQMLYGNSNRLDVARLGKLVGAFGNYTTATSSAAAARPGHPSVALDATVERVKGSPGRAPPSEAALLAMRDEPVLSEAALEAIKVVFSKEGSYAQEILVEELVAATDAMSREALSEALGMVMSSATVVSSLRSVEALGPLRAMLIPLPMPLFGSSTFGGARAFALTSDDRQALSTLRSVLDILSPSLEQMPNAVANGGRMMKAAGEVVPLLPELMPGVQATLELFVRQLVRRMALRLAEDLNPMRAYGM